MIPIKKEAVLITSEMIKPSDVGLEVVGTLNPAAIRLKNGDIVLYVRVIEKIKITEGKKYYYSPRCSGKSTCEVVFDKIKKEDVEKEGGMAFIYKDGTKRLTYISHLRRVILDKDGFTIKKIDKKPSFQGLKDDGEFGVEDARITKINNKYYMTYVTLSSGENISTSLAVSSNALNWERKGIIFGEQNKDCVLFPEKINGDYVAFDRPEGNFEFTPPHIWLSFSKDLIHWGSPSKVILSKRGKWDYARVGAGPPPIKTEKGWLLLYHGVEEKVRTKNKLLKKINKMFFGLVNEYSVYSIGAALFDLKNPRTLIAKTKRPLIVPKRSYEKKGFVDNVVFSTGLVLDENKKDLLIYSGGADKVVTVKKIKLNDILKSLSRA